MRTALRIGAGVAVAAGILLPVGVQAQTEGDSNAQIDITKVVEGEVPPGTTFDVQIDCNNGATVNSAPEGGPTTQTITFDETGGTQSVEPPQFNVICSVTETGTGGADVVTYEPGEQGDGCQVSTTEEGASVENQGNGDTCGVIITNTFGEPEPEPDAVEPADVVDTQPAFTG